MDAFQSRFAQTMRANLETAIKEHGERLISTGAVDYADYRQQVGFIRGLQHAVKEARELEEALSRPEDAKTPTTNKRQSYEV